MLLQTWSDASSSCTYFLNSRCIKIPVWCCTMFYQIPNPPPRSSPKSPLLQHPFRLPLHLPTVGDWLCRRWPPPPSMVVLGRPQSLAIISFIGPSSGKLSFYLKLLWFFKFLCEHEIVACQQIFGVI